MRKISSLAVVTLVAAASPAGPPLLAQAGGTGCRVLCAPTVSLMPAMIRSHLFGGPRVRTLASGAEQRLGPSNNFEMIVVAAAATALPRVGVFGSVQWLPNATESRNPFTLYTASELGEAIHANAPTATAGVSITALTAQQLHGWADLSGVVGTLFSRAAQPNDRSAYTHKLDLELVTHIDVFVAVPPRTYLHRVQAFGILDYVASGLPHAGDEVPIGRRFLTDARPTSLIVGLVLPVTQEVK